MGYSSCEACGAESYDYMLCPTCSLHKELEKANGQIANLTLKLEHSTKLVDELTGIIKMCDEALDEFGAGYCSLNNTSAKPEDVVDAVIEAMATLRGRIKYKD